MKSEDIDLSIYHHPERDAMIADIWYRNEHLAEISEEDDLLLLTIFPHRHIPHWKLPLSEMIEGISAGQKKIQQCQRKTGDLATLFKESKEDIESSLSSLEAHLLDFDKTLKYITSCLGDNQSLSAAIQKEIAFKKGVFFTLIPTGADSFLYDFSYDQVLPLNKNETDHELVAALLFENINKIKEPTLSLIQKWMSEKNESFICEGFDHPVSDPRVIFEKIPTLIWGAERYCYTNSTKIDSQILKESLLSGKLSSHFIGVLFKEEEGLFKEDRLQEGAFERIAKNASLVLVGAYNGDGYIFWQKDPFDLHSIGIPVANVKEI